MSEPTPIYVDMAVLSPGCGVDLTLTSDAEDCPPCTRIINGKPRHDTHADFILVTTGHVPPDCKGVEVPMCEDDAAVMRRAGRGRCQRCGQSVPVVNEIVL